MDSLETNGSPSPSPSPSSKRSSGSFPPTPTRQGSFFSRDFGQKIDLCARLREILINYPSGTTILKEFVQNADDAGGSSVRFCVDQRTFPTESLADEKLAEFQGPSMLIYNNGVFSDDDFESIQRIGDSLKKEKLAQIGRFGIGFNSCYHLTEMPSFLSRSSLVMFDPQAKFIPEINPANPGKLVDILDEEVQEHFPDQLAPFRAFGLDFTEEYNGTIFRLPLRTALQAETSKLTQQVYTSESLLDLLRVFKDDAQHCLLFLKSVTSIEAMVWRQDQDHPDVLWQVHVENESPDLAAARSLIPVAVTEAQKAALETNRLDYTPCESDYEMHISIKTFGDGAKTQTNKWAVCATCQDASGMAGKLACDPMSFSLKLVPWAGVATMFETSGQDEPDAITGRPFCFLPLPADTGLPVHVHGFFELSSNRRDIWSGEDMAGEGLIRVEWNKALLEGIIAPTYARLLLRLTKLAVPSNLRRYYALWPWDSVPEPWALVVRHLYAVAGDLPVLYSEVDGGRWVCPRDARYVPETWRHATELRKVLLDAGQPVVEVPARLRRTLAAFSLPLADVTPTYVRELLVQNGRPPVVDKDRAVGLRLLEYCVSDLRSSSEPNTEVLLGRAWFASGNALVVCGAEIGGRTWCAAGWDEVRAAARLAARSDVRRNMADVSETRPRGKAAGGERGGRGDDSGGREREDAGLQGADGGAAGSRALRGDGGAHEPGAAHLGHALRPHREHPAAGVEGRGGSDVDGGEERAADRGVDPAAVEVFRGEEGGGGWPGRVAVGPDARRVAVQAERAAVARHRRRDHLRHRRRPHAPQARRSHPALRPRAQRRRQRDARCRPSVCAAAHAAWSVGGAEKRQRRLAGACGGDSAEGHHGVGEARVPGVSDGLAVDVAVELRGGGRQGDPRAPRPRRPRHRLLLHLLLLDGDHDAEARARRRDRRAAHAGLHQGRDAGGPGPLQVPRRPDRNARAVVRHLHLPAPRRPRPQALREGNARHAPPPPAALRRGRGLLGPPLQHPLCHILDGCVAPSVRPLRPQHAGAPGALSLRRGADVSRGVVPAAGPRRDAGALGPAHVAGPRGRDQRGGGGGREDVRGDDAHHDPHRPAHCLGRRRGAGLAVPAPSRRRHHLIVATI